MPDGLLLPRAVLEEGREFQRHAHLRRRLGEEVGDLKEGGREGGREGECVLRGEKKSEEERETSANQSSDTGIEGEEAEAEAVGS